MAIDFPTAPTIGQLHPDPAVVGVPQYEWDGSVWVARVDDTLTYVKRSGDTMTGHLVLPITPAAANAVRKDFVVAKAGGADGIMTGLLTLSGDPTAALQAATKQYVDSHILIKTVRFLAGGTYTPSANLISAFVEVQGAGGGGGGCAGLAGYCFSGGGGGGGGYCCRLVTAAQVGASQAVGVGAAGVGGIGSSTNGSAGGGSSFGALCTAGGGAGGTHASNVNLPSRGAGGGNGPGDHGFSGEDGSGGLYYQGADMFIGGAGDGGNSFFGVGGRCPSAWGNLSSSGLIGTGYGGGGGGGSVHSASGLNPSGGNGSAGIVFITEFCRR